ncbi:hypothetical protein R70006_06090 [Paraburkholderia domus]|jgi:hypothetical protein|nr:hypothetical protein R70006_06090 [Paraburkholderia domus]CAE6942497.1 hypothetical protein R75471_05438 [Paraburkholderia domus]
MPEGLLSRYAGECLLSGLGDLLRDLRGRSRLERRVHGVAGLQIVEFDVRTGRKCL